MRNRIVSSLRNSGDPELTKAAGAVSQNFVFEYPSIRELASAVSALVGLWLVDRDGKCVDRWAEQCTATAASARAGGSRASEVVHTLCHWAQID